MGAQLSLRVREFCVGCGVGGASSFSRNSLPQIYYLIISQLPMEDHVAFILLEKLFQEVRHYVGADNLQWP